MYSYLTDEMVWALIREREDESRKVRPHTEGWPQLERAMVAPNPLKRWLSLAFRTTPPREAHSYR